MERSQPVTLTIFGISGDLAPRKLLPALYWLLVANQLPAHFTIIGAPRREVTVESLMAATRTHIGTKADSAVIDRLAGMIELVQMDSGNSAEYDKLRAVLERIEEGTRGLRLLYLSIPPTSTADVVTAMTESGITKDEQATTRLMLEKPFGFDVASAEDLNARLFKALPEEQLYRIDHYLAKETAQNLTVFRFQNPVMMALWNSDCIERIEIEATEHFGIEGRSDFYEQTGALRDMVQSHLLSLMALVVMNEPNDDTTESFQVERRAVLEAIKPISEDQIGTLVKRGQYDNYRQEVGNPDSTTETFAAMQLSVDMPHWKGVPIQLSFGKALGDTKRTEIRIIFKPSPRYGAANRLIFRVQPNEGVILQLEAKREGLSNITMPMFLNYTYATGANERQPDGYERVLRDAIAGERSSFLTGPEVLATWRLIDPVQKTWSRTSDDLITYRSGTEPSELL